MGKYTHLINKLSEMALSPFNWTAGPDIKQTIQDAADALKMAQESPEILDEMVNAMDGKWDYRL